MADIGLVGLGVMGANLALNMAEKGYSVAVYNRTTAKTEAFVANAGSLAEKLTPCATLTALGEAVDRRGVTRDLGRRLHLPRADWGAASEHELLHVHLQAQLRRLRVHYPHRGLRARAVPWRRRLPHVLRVPWRDFVERRVQSSE